MQIKIICDAQKLDLPISHCKTWSHYDDQRILKKRYKHESLKHKRPTL